MKGLAGGEKGIAGVSTVIFSTPAILPCPGSGECPLYPSLKSLLVLKRRAFGAGIGDINENIAIFRELKFSKTM